MGLMKETPEAKSWIYDALLKAGIRLPTVEGYSVRNDRVTALFERLKSTIDVQEWSEEEIGAWLDQLQDKEDWFDRRVLASTLEVPLYLVLWKNGEEKFRILSVTIKNKGIKVKDEKFFSSCKDLAIWMSELKGISVSKSFIESGRLSSIDDCLRSYGVPWPGNLDGFLLSSKSHNISVIFELSRTRKFPVKTHDLNRYYNADVNRWKALDILRKQLDVPLYILIWSSEENLVKIHKLQKITEKGLNYEKTELLPKEQTVPWFSQLIKEN